MPFFFSSLLSCSHKWSGSAVICLWRLAHPFLGWWVQEMRSSSNPHVAGYGSWQICNLWDQLGFSRLFPESPQPWPWTRVPVAFACDAVPTPGSLRYQQPRRKLAGSQAGVRQKLAGTSGFPQNTSVCINQGSLIKIHLVTGKSLKCWCGTVYYIPRAQCAYFAIWEGILSQTSAVGSEQLSSSLPYFFMCILYTKLFQAGCSDAAAWNLFSRNRNICRTFYSFLLFQFFFFFTASEYFHLAHYLAQRKIQNCYGKL